MCQNATFDIFRRNKGYTPAFIHAPLWDFFPLMEESKTPHGGKANAAWGKGKRRMGEKQTPHRAFPNNPFGGI